MCRRRMSVMWEREYFTRKGEDTFDAKNEGRL